MKHSLFLYHYLFINIIFSTQTVHLHFSTLYLIPTCMSKKHFTTTSPKVNIHCSPYPHQLLLQCVQQHSSSYIVQAQHVNLSLPSLIPYSTQQYLSIAASPKYFLILLILLTFTITP